MRCECGCGWEGEDEVAQWLIEEAVLLKQRAGDVIRSRERAAELEKEATHMRLVEMANRVGR